jgi:hypothetical protein
MKKWLTGILGLELIALLAAFLVTGCENVQTTDNNIIEVSPTSLAVTGRYIVVYSVSAGSNSLYMPLQWSVSDPRLGTVTQSGALSALYQPNDLAGVNTITVRDQAEAVGFASIDQLLNAGMGLSPATATLATPGDVLTFAVTNASPDSLALPLEWSVSDSSMGNISASGGLTAIYVSHDQRGNNLVFVRDQMGASAWALVQQIW